VGKKPNLDQLKGAALCSQRYIDAKAREATAESERHRARGRVDALSTKRDMLISLGAHIRLELLRDPAVRKRMSRLEAENEYEDEDENEDVPI